MLSVKVSTKHQIVVPSLVRRTLDIEAGDRLDVEIAGDVVVLRKRPRRPSDRLRGIASGAAWYDPDPVAFVRRLRDETDARAREREELIAHGRSGGTSAGRARQ